MGEGGGHVQVSMRSGSNVLERGGTERRSTEAFWQLTIGDQGHRAPVMEGEVISGSKTERQARGNW